VSVEVILPRLTQELAMNIQNDTPATALRRRMIEDMAARNLGPHSRRNYLNSCARLAAFLGRSPDTATADDNRLAVVAVQLMNASLSRSISFEIVFQSPFRHDTTWNSSKKGKSR
jgi:hypothetical protein